MAFGTFYFGSVMFVFVYLRSLLRLAEAISGLASSGLIGFSQVYFLVLPMGL